MIPPRNLLVLLSGGALGAAGILQGLHWKAMRAPTGMPELESRLREAAAEIEMLRRENESLRSLAQGGGELSVPRELVTRVERESGLRFLSSPVVHRIAREELRDRVAAAIESRMGPSGIDDRQEAWRLIGWLRPDDNLLAQLAAIRVVGANGWFDDVTGEAWMSDKADLRNIPDQAALLRLLTRILFHQHFPPPPAHPGDDPARAREALHEGTAAGVEARFYGEKARDEGFMPMKENTDSKLLLASLPQFLQGLASFPGVEGKGYADSLHVKGNDALHAAFRSPPQSTRAILGSDESAAPLTPTPPDAMEEPYLAESAGQLGLLLWIRTADEASASRIAGAWRGDRYFLFPDGGDSAAVLWDIELASREAADALEKIAGTKIAAMTDESGSPPAAPKLSAPIHRVLKVARVSPTRLRFLNTADAATARKFGSQ